MARRLVEVPEKRKVPERGEEKLVIPVDPVNEAAILVSAARSREVLASLARRLVPDHFQSREFRAAWQALLEVHRRGLEVSNATVQAVAGEGPAKTLHALSSHPTVRNLDFHVQFLLWDAARASAARGPVNAFLEALRDPRADPGRVRSLAQQIAQSLDGHQDRKYLLDPDALVAEQMSAIDKRVEGFATYPFGIDGLDFYDEQVNGVRRRRMLPGTAPGCMTLVTGMTGGGKSTFTAHIILGTAFPGGVESDEPGRRVLAGAWEKSGRMTLELLACISLGWSRTDMTHPAGNSSAPINAPEGRKKFRERMGRIAERVRFMDNPFRRMSSADQKQRASNDRNLDVVHGYIADSGCEIFVADLWARCLVGTKPDEEQAALERQQAMAEELKVHVIAVHQQRFKDIELRADKRPTREGIKGSGGYLEIPDTVIAPHRPALYKTMEDRTLELFVLKQRDGVWPLGIEFDWDPDTGGIWGGREIQYDQPGEVDEFGGGALDQRPTKGRRR